MNKIVLLLMVCLLSACAPKTRFLNPELSEPSFTHIEIMVDYVHFVDGIDNLMDYDADKNQQRINHIKEQLSQVLTSKEFSVDWALLSSGVGLHPDMAFAYYRDGERQPEVIYPPFLIESPYPYIVQYQLIDSFMDAQRVALTPVSKENQRYLQRVRAKTIDFRPLKNPSGIENESTKSLGVLYLRVLAPRTSFLKTLGSGVISVGVSSGSVRGSHVGIGLPLTSGDKSLTTAVLFDNTNGQIVWKNQRAGDISRLSNDGFIHFFKDFPVRP